jgi:hypothetical protein
MTTLTGRDPLPALRRELDLSRVATGVGAEVYRLRSGGGLAPQLMHGYELSVARMLDGHRTVEDVLFNCERIGVPMDVKALEGLLERLGKAGFLADPVHPGMGQHDPHVPHRDAWTLEVRDLFREALKAAREGDFAAAREAVDSMLQVAPGTGEAVRLREWILRQHAAAADKALSVELRRSEAKLRGGRAAMHLRPKVQKWFARPPRWLLPTVMIAACAALLAATTFLPVSRYERARVRLEPLTRATMLTTAPVVVEKVMVKDGDLVVPGQPLVQWRAPAGVDAVLRASEAGEVHRMRLTVGKQLMKNQEAMQLIDRSQMRVVVAVTPRAAKHTKPGDLITLELPDRVMSMVVEAVEDYELLGTVSNGDRSLAMKTMEANIELPARSLWESMR